MGRTLALAVVTLVTACEHSREDAARSLDPVPAVDLDPDPNVVRVALVAEVASVEILPGKPAEVWAYRDAGDPEAPARLPGPLLRTVAGQTLVVELTSDLPDATTIHWHGVRLPAAQDGTPASQVLVQPGETYTYAFTTPDAGTFWYHPHVDADVQIERGLYGALVVDEPEPLPVDAVRVLVLDDVKLEASGELSPDTDALDLMLGRQGNVLLVNGRRDASFSVAAGTRERWRFVNAANGRYFALRLSGAGVRAWTLVASDGGLLAAPRPVADVLLVAPGERHDVLVEIGDEPGTRAQLETVHYDRGHDIPDPGPLPLVTIDVGDPIAAPAERTMPAGTFAPLPIDATAPREIVLTEDDSVAEDPRFFINGLAFPEHEAIEGALGTVEVWALRNDTEMDHPFHVHGTFFQVLDAAGAPDPARGLKDTVNVPRDSTVAIAVAFDNPGDWMIHCHILEHAERGMMSMLHVRP